MYSSFRFQGSAHPPWTAPHRCCLRRIVVLVYLSRRMEIFIWLEGFSNVIVDFMAMCSYLYSGFSNKSGRGRPGLSRGDCHSGWPFCTWLGLATSLDGRLTSRLLRHARRGDLAGRLTLTWWLTPLWMRVDTVSYPHACVVSPPRRPYISHFGPGEGIFAWTTIIVNSRRRYVTAYYRGRRNHPN